MLRAKFSDNKGRREHHQGWLLDGKRVMRLHGMIYWYAWGDHEFDIRVIRRICGKPEDGAHDKWFMTEPPDPRGSFVAQMQELADMVAGRKFGELIAEHDRILCAATHALPDDCPF